MNHSRPPLPEINTKLRPARPPLPEINTNHELVASMLRAQNWAPLLQGVATRAEIDKAAEAFVKKARTCLLEEGDALPLKEGEFFLPVTHGRVQEIQGDQSHSLAVQRGVAFGLLEAVAKQNAQWSVQAPLRGYAQQLDWWKDANILSPARRAHADDIQAQLAWCFIGRSSAALDEINRNRGYQALPFEANFEEAKPLLNEDPLPEGVHPLTRPMVVKGSYELIFPNKRSIALQTEAAHLIGEGAWDHAKSGGTTQIRLNSDALAYPFVNHAKRSTTAQELAAQARLHRLQTGRIQRTTSPQAKTRSSTGWTDEVTNWLASMGL